MPNIHSLRTDYTKQHLVEEHLATNAIRQFETWWNEAINNSVVEPNAMTLCTTSTKDNMPNARIVLLKEWNEKGFVFFSNYESDKAEQMKSNPNVCLLFFWKEMERQIKINGSVSKVSAEESNAYFSSRPLSSQIAAWASTQSKKINNRQVLEDNYKHFEEKFATQVPTPPHWGGYFVEATSIEFWQGRASRLHDRILYTKDNDTWSIERLAP